MSNLLKFLLTYMILYRGKTELSVLRHAETVGSAVAFHLIKISLHAQYVAYIRNSFICLLKVGSSKMFKSKALGSNSRVDSVTRLRSSKTCSQL